MAAAYGSTPPSVAKDDDVPMDPKRPWQSDVAIGIAGVIVLVPTLVFIDDDSKRNITSLVIIVLTVGWIATRIGMRIRQRRGAGSESFSYAAVTTEDEPAAGDLDEDTITATF